MTKKQCFGERNPDCMFFCDQSIMWRMEDFCLTFWMHYIYCQGGFHTTGNSSQLVWMFSFTLHLSSHYFIKYHMNTSANDYHLFFTWTCAINGNQFPPRHIYIVLCNSAWSCMWVGIMCPWTLFLNAFILCPVTASLYQLFSALVHFKWSHMNFQKKNI